MRNEQGKGVDQLEFAEGMEESDVKGAKLSRLREGEMECEGDKCTTTILDGCGRKTRWLQVVQ